MDNDERDQRETLTGMGLFFLLAAVVFGLTAMVVGDVPLGLILLGGFGLLGGSFLLDGFDWW